MQRGKCYKALPEMININIELGQQVSLFGEMGGAKQEVKVTDRVTSWSL